MKISRRDFLHISVLSAGAAGLATPALGDPGARGTINLALDPQDPLIASPAVRWALEELEGALQVRSLSVRRVTVAGKMPASGLTIVVASAKGANALAVQTGAVLPTEPESLAIVPSRDGHSPMGVYGADSRGLMYALLELADCVRHAEEPIRALLEQKPLREQPLNPIRSLGRLFVSDVEDKAWFYDREMWPAYLAMLATQRFNRFSLNFGIGYDSLQTVKDAYLLFAYPFLLSLPDYNVRAVNLADAERDRNLDTLRYISSQAVAHGIDFQLGIWTHGYQWGDPSQANYTIQGLTPENHAAYSRDALAALLKACPDISGVTIRTHGESGVREKSYAFWETVFSGISNCGRTVRLDLHTKGLDQRLVDIALATGLPVTLSPKYWAEHMGLPYHQAAIRDSEMPKQDFDAEAFDSLSTGSRIVTRYGYADFLREDRRYQVMHRIWPGTHRFLLWGDPLSAAAYSRAFRFCGSDGVELYEPLSFKGRRGSGVKGHRCAYSDASLNPRWDWEKYLYTYRVWGRLIYNPEAEAEVWRRPLRQFRQAAEPLEASLAHATRILPLVTTAHLPSAANDAFGPELYANQSMLNSSDPPYWDTPVPKTFGVVSPLDPQIFSAISEYVADVMKGEHSAKYSPVEVASWLEDLAAQAETHLTEAVKRSLSAANAEFRRIAIDVRLQAGLGHFFAAKLRAGVLQQIHRQSGSRVALEKAVEQYGKARGVWALLAQKEGKAYVSDITFGPLFQQRGHWQDRLAAIDDDIAALAAILKDVPRDSVEPPAADAAIREALGRPGRPSIAIHHAPPTQFVSGEPLTITASAASPSLNLVLHYRHVNQAERYQKIQMQKSGSAFVARIPASYTSTKFPLQYYFELREDAGHASLYPGFRPELDNQPYFVIRLKA